MPKTVIIPDIHTKFSAAEFVIGREKPDRTVFLGDYFDSYYETESDTHNTAQWLYESLQNKDRTHLIGNHDLSYMAANPRLKCSGFSESKQFIINKYKIPWEQLRPYCYVGDYLCTHAGISRNFFEQYATTGLAEFIAESDEDVMHLDDGRYRDRFFQAGTLRGGTAGCGGIFWCDYDEFEDIAGTRQVFGHTRADDVRQTEHHICLDTGLNHYAVHENGKIRVVKTGGPRP